MVISFRSFILFASISLFLVASGTLYAQETQIPLDDQNKLDFLTPELEEELHIFPEIERFRGARLFQISDYEYVLEIESLSRGKITRTRRMMNKEEMIAFRNDLGQRIRQQEPTIYLDHEGRTSLITGVTSLTAAFYGWAIPTVLEMNEEPAIGSYFLLTGAGFVIPYLATQNSRVTDAMARLGIYGGTRGIVDGALLYWLFADDDKWDDKGLIGTMMATSLLELGSGIAIASANDLSGGQASVISTCGTFGLGIGLAGYGMTEPVDATRTGAAMGIGGTLLGYTVGTMLANDQNYSVGDGTVFSTAGWLGVALPTTVLLMLDDKKENMGTEYYGTAILGSIAGLWLGHELVRGKDFSSSQGNYVVLGTSGGALIGMGLGYMVRDNVELKWPLLIGSISATAMYAIMVNSFSDEARAAHEASGISSSWNFDISPLGLASAMGAGGMGNYPVPVATFSYRW